MAPHAKTMSAVASDWVAPEHVTLPHFIICGAMKSGTTTLHHMLGRHPDVFIPDREVHFFDLDNLLQHPDFNWFDGTHWTRQAIEEGPHMYWDWYSSHFAAARPGQQLGEDSTTYIASELAMRRIALQRKPIKLIVMLRHPTKRAYSQYWHLVRTGRATHSFEDTIQYTPHVVLDRSMYLQQLRSILLYVPRERVEIVIFEDFVNDTARSMDRVCSYLELAPDVLPRDALGTHTNAAMTPRHVRMELMHNRWFRRAGNLRYVSQLPVGPVSNRMARRPLLARTTNKLYRLANPLVETPPPTMNRATRDFLDRFFKRELAGLDDLIGRDVLSTWFD